MKKKKSFLPYILILLLIGIVLLVSYQHYRTHEKVLPTLTKPTSVPIEETKKSEENTLPLEFKDLLPSSSGEIVEHQYYTLSYSEDHEQAEWVFYELNPEMVNGSATRGNHFCADPSVSTGSASLEDYKASGYDRGHLCPAASMSINQVAMDESFFLSNMSPQLPSFNRGAWKKLEEQVRDWARTDQQLFVISGPILKEGLPAIGANEVSVPEQYYKIIYAPLQKKMIAFLMPNATISLPLSTFAVPVDSIETLTSINFFSALPDSMENQLERSFQIENWDFRR